MNPPPVTTPRAWLGLAEQPANGRPCVRICCACPDRRDAEARAERDGYTMTHTYCPACLARAMEELSNL